MLCSDLFVIFFLFFFSRERKVISIIVKISQGSARNGETVDDDETL